MYLYIYNVYTLMNTHLATHCDGHPCQVYPAPLGRTSSMWRKWKSLPISPMVPGGGDTRSSLEDSHS